MKVRSLPETRRIHSYELCRVPRPDGTRIPGYHDNAPGGEISFCGRENHPQLDKRGEDTVQETREFRVLPEEGTR